MHNSTLVIVVVSFIIAVSISMYKTNIKLNELCDIERKCGFDNVTVIDTNDDEDYNYIGWNIEGNNDNCKILINIHKSANKAWEIQYDYKVDSDKSIDENCDNFERLISRYNNAIINYNSEYIDTSRFVYKIPDSFRQDISSNSYDDFGLNVDNNYNVLYGWYYDKDCEAYYIRIRFEYYW